MRERDELQGLGDDGPAERAAVVHRQPDVHRDVLEDLSQIGRLALVRVVVQQQHRHAALLGRPQERSQPERIGSAQIEVGIPVPDVDLQREPDLDRGPGQPGVHHRMGDPVPVP